MFSLTGPMTAARTLTLSATNAFEGATARILHEATGGFSWAIKNAAGTTLLTVSAGADPLFLATGGDWRIW